MEVIAITKGGVLISATVSEVNEVLRSVNGTAPKELSIGQKIPAIDYAASITKVKSLKGAWEYTNLCSAVDTFNNEMGSLRQAVENAASTEVGRKKNAMVAKNTCV
jgi:hypothetical protein